MRGDFTRRSFDRRRRYRAVQHGQGMVALDAYWNEQQDITLDCIETEAADILGPTAAPLDGGGFRLEIDKAKLLPAELADGQAAEALGGADFYLTRGRIYVAGRQVDNDRLTTFEGQPDGIDRASEAVANGLFMAYLCVRPHLVTALDEPGLRDPALGAADVATRIDTVWTVGILKVADDPDVAASCAAAPVAWQGLVDPTLGTMTAETTPATTSATPCVVPATAGYRRLSNQLYRVEIVAGGAPGTAAFVWSRDNGSMAAAWTGTDAAAAAVTIEPPPTGPGRGFKTGDWAELTTLQADRRRIAGPFFRVTRAEPSRLLLDGVAIPPLPVAADPAAPARPRVRQWNGGSTTVPADGSAVALEDGIAVRFSTAGQFRVGDYWLIPARARTGDIEWPSTLDGTPGGAPVPEGVKGKPVPVPPHGIEDRFARLGLLRRKGGAWVEAIDCRPVFPPLSDLLSFQLLGGDGQEATPDPLAPGQMLPLAQALRVGVFYGKRPVAGARVRFTPEPGHGGVDEPQPIATGPDGIAEASWRIGDTVPIQALKAELLASDNTVRGPAIAFGARLRRAAEVAYDPAACTEMQAAGIVTVQAAIDHLCARPVGAGGGCDVTVGDEGQFPTIDKALRELANKGVEDICLCLLPGEHKLADTLELSIKGSNVSIHGCGKALARLHIEGQRANLLARSIELRAFGIVTAKPGDGLVLTARTIALADLAVSGPAAPDGLGLLILDAAEHLSLLRCEIEVPVQLATRPVIDLIRRARPELADVLEPADRPARLVAVTRATAAVGTADEAKATATNLRRLLVRSRLTDEEKAAVTSVADGLEASPATPDAAVPTVTDRLAGIRPRGAGPATALSIAGMGADTLIDACTIDGDLMFGTKPAELPPLDQTFKTVLAAMKGGAGIRPSAAVLRLTGNRLGAIILGAEWVDRLTGLMQGKPLEGVFTATFVRENILGAVPLVLLARQHNVGDNRFAASADFGVVVGESGSYLGNWAGNDFRLWSACQLSSPRPFSVGATQVQQMSNFNVGINIVTS